MACFLFRCHHGQEKHPGAEPLPLSVIQSVMQVDMDLRKELVGNIVCVGGSSCLNGFTERLAKEVAALASPVRIPELLCGLRAFLCVVARTERAVAAATPRFVGLSS